MEANKASRQSLEESIAAAGSLIRTPQTRPEAIKAAIEADLDLGIPVGLPMGIPLGSSVSDDILSIVQEAKAKPPLRVRVLRRIKSARGK